MFLILWLLAASTPADQSMTPEAVCARALPSKYTAQAGDTADSVAKKFQLKPVTVLGANPAIQERAVRSGDILTILPKDGILYKPKPEDRFPEIAQRFRVSADILFEINGCQMQTELFIPGVLWQAPPPKPKPVVVPAPVPAPQKAPIPVLRLPQPPVPEAKKKKKSP
jgi:LysM repeat protein